MSEEIAMLELILTRPKVRRNAFREWCEVFTPESKPIYEKKAIEEVRRFGEVTIWTLVVVGEWDASAAFGVGELVLVAPCMFANHGIVTPDTKIIVSW